MEKLTLMLQVKVSVNTECEYAVLHKKAYKMKV